MQKNKEDDSLIPSPHVSPYESYMQDQNKLHLISIASINKIKNEGEN